MLNHGGTLVVSAIHGLGSVGKSTLAAALAHDPEIQSHFCDGILWTTLGQEPNISSELQRWVQALETDQRYPATSSIEATTAHLRTLLFDKTVLLVVDDAWDSEKARHFQVGGSRCQMLVTTRDDSLAHPLGASIHRLNVMKLEQAMELLTKKLKLERRELQEAERQTAEKLAKAVGYLPLALELAAAQLARGTSFEVLLKDITQEIARLKSFDLRIGRDVNNEAVIKKYSLQASLNLSVKRLLEDERENFIWLGVLPEDAIITQGMAKTLWDVDDERDARDRLRDLCSQALLLPGVTLTHEQPTYRLHDLFHDLARNLLTAPSKPKGTGDLSGLGFEFADAQLRLLERYRKQANNKQWHTLPDDGYIHQRLVWHLEKAGRLEEIHQLLHSESRTGSNGWYEVREKLGQTAGYLTDILKAWELAEATWNEAILPKVVSLQCHYALITASLNSLAANLPDKLLIALVKKKVWNPEQGLAYALQTPEPYKKVKSLLTLVDDLSPTRREQALPEALEAARAIQSELYRAEALTAVAEKLPSVLPEALEAAKAIQSERYCAEALADIAEKLPSVLPEALGAVRAIQDEWHRARALTDIAEKLPPELPKALEVARAIQDKSDRAEAITAIALHLSQMQTSELVPLWQDSLRELSLRTRSNFLQDLTALVPVIFALGGSEALASVSSNVQQVGRWWP